MNKTVLVVAAHPDDEALGCGGTIARHIAEGDSVYATFVADGVSSRIDAAKKERQQREAAAAEACAILGIKDQLFLGFPDNRLDDVALLDIVQAVEKQFDALLPQIIYTHHSGDLNIDHRVTHDAVVTAARPLPGCPIAEIYSFEIISSTEWAGARLLPFQPNVFVDIGAFLETKMRALRAYTKEMRAFPHSRSYEHVLALARHRGCTAGVEAAEGFMLVRSVR